MMSDLDYSTTQVLFDAWTKLQDNLRFVWWVNETIWTYTQASKAFIIQHDW